MSRGAQGLGELFGMNGLDVIHTIPNDLGAKQAKSEQKGIMKRENNLAALYLLKHN